MIADELLQSLRRRAHVHTDRCFGRYEPCGEHHAHDDECGSRPRVCGLREEPELALLLDEVDSLRPVAKAARALSVKLAHCGSQPDERWFRTELTALDAALAAETR